MKKYYFLFGLIFFAFINPTLAQDFEVPLTVTDDNHSITLWFGVDPLGTDGFDVGLDTLAPPPPPSGFDARFNLLAFDFLTDIRDNLITEKQFHLEYQPEIGDEPIVLYWDSSLLNPLGTFFIVDDITGTLWGPLDMKTTDSLVVTDPLILSGLRILVTPVDDSNSPPDLDPIADQNMDEGGTLDVPVNATDPDLDNITLSSPNLPGFGNLVDNGDGTGTITFTPDFTQYGVYPDIMVIATDDGTPSLSDTTTFTLTVGDVNRPPELDPISDQNMNENETLPVPLNATDPDGDNITLSSPNLPAFGALVDNGDGTGTITFTPDFTQSGVYPDIMVIATDDGTPSLSDTTTFTLTVGDVNRAPELDPIANQSMEEEETLDVPVSSTDPDGDNITLTIENAPTFTAFVDNGDGTGTITFTPALGDMGSYPNIRVIAIDDGTPSLSDTTIFTLTVTLGPNAPPELDPIADQTMNVEETLDVPVNSTDPDGDNITLTIENAPTFTAFVDNGDGTGTITFTPLIGDAGVYPNIRVIATDDGTPSLSDTTTFNLIVNTNIGIPVEINPDNALGRCDEDIMIPIVVGDLTGQGIIAFEFIVTFDETILISADGINIVGDIDFTSWTISHNAAIPGEISVAGFGVAPLSGSGIFLYLLFHTSSEHNVTSPLDFTNFIFNAGSPLANTTNGSITLQCCICGDADQNELVQAFDAALTLQHVLSIITLDYPECVDVDMNGLVQAYDASLILHHVLGLDVPDPNCWGENPSNGDKNKLLKIALQIEAEDVKKNGNETEVVLGLSGFDNTTGVSAIQMEVELPDGESNIVLSELPIEYLSGINNIEGNIYRIGIVNPYGIDASEIKLVLKSKVDMNGEILQFSNIYINSQVHKDINTSLTGIFIPEEYSIGAYPNPFNPSTRIIYTLPVKSNVEIKVFDILGREVIKLIDQEFEAGTREVEWNATNDYGIAISSGTYIVTIKANHYFKAIKISFLK